MRYPGFLIAFGSSGTEVKQIQERLVELGYNGVETDSVYGEMTRQVVIEFQRTNRLAQDGIVGKLSWDALFNISSVVKKIPYPGVIYAVGSTGDNVRLIQQQLNSLNFGTGNPDGIFGNNTANAVSDFQRTNYLKIDGMVGKLTWNALFYGTQTGIDTTLPFHGIPFGVGSAGDYVELVQRQLNRLQFDVGTPDGKFGPGTEQGVIKFQTSINLKADGVVGEQTWNRLMASSSGGEYVNNNTPYPGVTLRNGSTGQYVMVLQRQLNSRGYPIGKVDGIFGAKTENQVRTFQTTMGLAVDGKVGRLTWDALLKNNNANVSIPYPGTLLRKGSSGESVKKVQIRLNEMGFTADSSDGIFGDKTHRAVINFQYSKNIQTDGIVGPKTWNVLFNGYSGGIFNPTNRRYPGQLIAHGSRGESVRLVQETLIALGYLNDVADGIFGDKTRQAVIAYQYDKRLKVDGIVGSMTWNELFSIYAPSNPSSGGGGGGYDGPPIPGVLKVFIDAGHGGYDSGAVGNGLKESDLVLRISQIQRDALVAAGYSVKMSRTTDTYLSLKQRTDMANQWGADLFISNHINAGGGKGSEVFASIYGGPGRNYANEIAKNLSRMFYNRGVKTRQGDNGDYYHVIRETHMPSVLVEHGFIDNYSDAQILKDSNNLREAAMATVNAIKKISPVVTPLNPKDPNENKVRAKSLFSKLFGGINETLNERQPNYKEEYEVSYKGATLKLEGKLITNDTVEWQLSKGIKQQELIDQFANAGINKIMERLTGIEKENILVWVNNKIANDGFELVEEIRISDPFEISFENKTLTIKSLSIEILYNTGYKDWKILEIFSVEKELQFDFNSDFDNSINLPIFEITLSILLLFILIALFLGILNVLGAAAPALAFLIAFLIGGQVKEEENDA